MIGKGSVKVKVTGEFYRVYVEQFGARLEGVAHEDFAHMDEALRRAYLYVGQTGNNTVVQRVTQHEPVPESESDGFFYTGKETETVTGELHVSIPHFTAPQLSRYHPVNGWVVPEFIMI